MTVGQDTLYGDDINQIPRIIKNGAYAPAGKGSYRSCDIKRIRSLCSRLFKLAGRSRSSWTPGTERPGSWLPLVPQARLQVVGRAHRGRAFSESPSRPDPAGSRTIRSCQVKATKAELGLAYDGDGDRIGVVDDEGALDLGRPAVDLFRPGHSEGFPGAVIISEVKATKVLYDEITRLGGKAVMWKAGHSLIEEDQGRGCQARRGMSGHMFFADRWFGFDDAIYCLPRVAELVARSPQRLSEMLAALPKTYSTEIRVHASEEVSSRSSRRSAASSRANTR